MKEVSRLDRAVATGALLLGGTGVVVGLGNTIASSYESYRVTTKQQGIIDTASADLKALQKAEDETDSTIAKKKIALADQIIAANNRIVDETNEAIRDGKQGLRVGIGAVTLLFDARRSGKPKQQVFSQNKKQA